MPNATRRFVHRQAHTHRFHSPSVTCLQLFVGSERAFDGNYRTPGVFERMSLQVCLARWHTPRLSTPLLSTFVRRVPIACEHDSAGAVPTCNPGGDGRVPRRVAAKVERVLVRTQALKGLPFPGPKADRKPRKHPERRQKGVVQVAPAGKAHPVDECNHAQAGCGDYGYNEAPIASAANWRARVEHRARSTSHLPCLRDDDDPDD